MLLVSAISVFVPYLYQISRVFNPTLIETFRGYVIYLYVCLQGFGEREREFGEYVRQMFKISTLALKPQLKDSYNKQEM